MLLLELGWAVWSCADADFERTPTTPAFASGGSTALAERERDHSGRAARKRIAEAASP
eukprot:CAMPEP_0206273020 /NCGR_PEP_ID=MMETSP0047_2-20121206/34354_1 /ASSEMBLY_ACC=CAM_ASM_000192 /TAXON_ID=195065 /ORGANISM="Chroomonas mesostigmatica_cf, Strain CCMP1168" /LENGTH=57 /DNA_ID=CAMNT_0053702051 /DNA_START=11 /DNA_END=181 /DNA_ORIENTATION=-